MSFAEASEVQSDFEIDDSVPYKSPRLEGEGWEGRIAPVRVMALYLVMFTLKPDAAPDGAARIWLYVMILSAPATVLLLFCLIFRGSRYVDSFILGSRFFCPELAPRLGDKLHLLWQADLGPRGQVEETSYEVRIVQVSRYPISGREIHKEVNEIVTLWVHVGPLERFGQGMYRVELNLPDRIHSVDPTEKYEMRADRLSNRWDVSFRCELSVSVRLENFSREIRDCLSLKLPGELVYTAPAGKLPSE